MKRTDFIKENVGRTEFVASLKAQFKNSYFVMNDMIANNIYSRVMANPENYKKILIEEMCEDPSNVTFFEEMQE